MSLSASRLVAIALLGLLAGSLPGCAGCQRPTTPETGDPERLDPILGGGRPALPTPVLHDEDDEGPPLEEFAYDLRALLPAWPTAAEELPGLLRAVLARGSWGEGGRQVATSTPLMVVRHRPEVVEQVRRLLRRLEQLLQRPMQLDVACVELPARLASSLMQEREGLLEWDMPGFDAAERRGGVERLAHLRLQAFNGEWASRAQLAHQPHISRLVLVDGQIVPETARLASGLSTQLAAWRWGEERAVVAFEGSYTGPGLGEQTAAQTVHRRLPSARTDETPSVERQARLPLPVRRLLEFSGQATLARGAWSVAALAPLGEDRTVAVLLRADWASPSEAPVAVQPVSGGRGFVLEIVPVALPADRRAGPAQPTFDNRLAFVDNPGTVAGFNERNDALQAAQRANVYNYLSPADQAGRVDQGRARKAASFLLSNLSSRDVGWSASPEPAQVSGLLPEPVERLRNEVMRADWPEGTALEFTAGHVFVVHAPAQTERVRRLLEQTMEWRNRPVALRVRFPGGDGPARTLPLGEGLDATQAKALASHGRVGDAWLAGRSEVTAHLFVAHMHTVLAGPWPPDSSSPALQVYWRGQRLEVQPRRGRKGDVWAQLGWQLYELGELGLHEVTDSLLQRPQDAVLSGKQTVRLPTSGGVLVEVPDAGPALRRALWLGLADQPLGDLSTPSPAPDRSPAAAPKASPTAPPATQ